MGTAWVEWLNTPLFAPLLHCPSLYYSLTHTPFLFEFRNIYLIYAFRQAGELVTDSDLPFLLSLNSYGQYSLNIYGPCLGQWNGHTSIYCVKMREFYKNRSKRTKTVHDTVAHSKKTKKKGVGQIKTVVLSANTHSWGLQGRDFHKSINYDLLCIFKLLFLSIGTVIYILTT